MKMLVLGAGLQGSACAYDLLQNDRIERVILADQKFDHIPAFISRCENDSRLDMCQIDARDEAALHAAMDGVDACMNALPYYFNLAVTKQAIAAGLHCCDLGGNTAIVFDQIALHEQALARDISVIPDCGLAPGMVNVLAAAGIAQLDETSSVKMFVGGLPQHPEPPIDYQIVYSLEGVLDYYTTPSWVIENGEPKQVDALSDVESVRFPEPVGELEAFHTAGGLSTMAERYQGKVQTVEYKTLRYPGHARIFRAIRGLGLLDQTPIKVNGQSVVPRDAFIAAAEPHLRKPHGLDLVALRVAVEGRKDGARRRITYDLLDYYDEAIGISAMERTTGYSLSITGQLQAERKVKGMGVRTPDQAIPADLYMDELRRREIRIGIRIE